MGEQQGLSPVIHRYTQLIPRNRPQVTTYPQVLHDQRKQPRPRSVPWLLLRMDCTHDDYL